MAAVIQRCCRASGHEACISFSLRFPVEPQPTTTDATWSQPRPTIVPPFRVRVRPLLWRTARAAASRVKILIALNENSSYLFYSLRLINFVWLRNSSSLQIADDRPRERIRSSSTVGEAAYWGFRIINVYLVTKKRNTDVWYMFLSLFVIFVESINVDFIPRRVRRRDLHSVHASVSV